FREGAQASADSCVLSQELNRTNQYRAIRQGPSRGQLRVLACRVPFLQIPPNQLPPQVGCEIVRPLLSSTTAGLPRSQVPDSSLLSTVTIICSMATSR